MKNSRIFVSLAALAAAVMIFIAAVYLAGSAGSASASVESAAGADAKTSSTSNSAGPSTPNGGTAVPDGLPAGLNGFAWDAGSVKYGQVTAINGSELTVALGSFIAPAGDGSGRALPPAQGTAPSQDTAPGRGDPWDPGMRGTGPMAIGGELVLTGETVIVTIKDNVTLAIRSADAAGNHGPQDGAPAALTDFTVGCTVLLRYEEGTDTLLAVEILSGGTEL